MLFLTAGIVLSERGGRWQHRRCRGCRWGPLCFPLLQNTAFCAIILSQTNNAVYETAAGEPSRSLPPLVVPAAGPRCTGGRKSRCKSAATAITVTADVLPPARQAPLKSECFPCCELQKTSGQREGRKASRATNESVFAESGLRGCGSHLFSASLGGAFVLFF